jgi:hypothetical protein
VAGWLTESLAGKFAGNVTGWLDENVAAWLAESVAGKLAGNDPSSGQIAI